MIDRIHYRCGGDVLKNANGSTSCLRCGAVAPSVIILTECPKCDTDLAVFEETRTTVVCNWCEHTFNREDPLGKPQN